MFQLAQFVNKLSFQLFELPRLVRDNDYVILDRWSLSALAYGPPTGANERFTRYLNSFLMKPDIVIVLTGEPFDRGEGANDTYDSDDELQHKVRQAYECLAIEECHPCVWVKGSREDVLERILNQLYCNGIVPQSMRPRSDRYATVEEVRT